MNYPRTYGSPPFTVAVIHGGPGAAGEMAPVARELASGWGVLEPLQTAASLEGQVEELKTFLSEQGDLPVTLIGFSWGAWLSFIVTGRYPALVEKLLLVGSGSFEEQYAADIWETRLSRLSREEQEEAEALGAVLEDPGAEDRNEALERFGELFSGADAYDPITDESDVIDYQAQIYQSVWQDAARLRRSGELLELGRQIQCPVVAIHGDHDSHPVEGVQKPLSAVLEGFRLILLEHCGHKPWIERQARARFYRVLKEELEGKTKAPAPIPGESGKNSPRGALQRDGLRKGAVSQEMKTRSGRRT